jgi:hypothetical protein
MEKTYLYSVTLFLVGYYCYRFLFYSYFHLRRVECSSLRARKTLDLISNNSGHNEIWLDESVHGIRQKRVVHDRT